MFTFGNVMFLPIKYLKNIFIYFIVVCLKKRPGKEEDWCLCSNDFTTIVPFYICYFSQPRETTQNGLLSHVGQPPFSSMYPVNGYHGATLMSPLATPKAVSSVCQVTRSYGIVANLNTQEIIKTQRKSSTMFLWPHKHGSVCNWDNSVKRIGRRRGAGGGGQHPDRWPVQSHPFFLDMVHPFEFPW